MTVEPITHTAAGTATGTDEAALVDQAALTVFLPMSGKLPPELPAEPPRGWFAPRIDMSGDIPIPTVRSGAEVPASGVPVPFPELNQRFPDEPSTADLRRILDALRRRQKHPDQGPSP